MDLARTMGVLRRHKLLIATGLIIGLMMGFIVSYKIDAGGGDRGVTFTRRSFATYGATVSLLLDVPGFGVGTHRQGGGQGGSMAPTFACIATSDAVRKRTGELVGQERLKEYKLSAAPVEGSTVIQVGAEGRDPAVVEAVAAAMAQAVVDYTIERQDNNSVPASDRLRVQILGAPMMTPTQSRRSRLHSLHSWLPCCSSSRLAFGAENLRMNREKGSVAAEPASTSAEHGVADPQPDELPRLKAMGS